MTTLWGLFSTYQDARSVLSELSRRGFAAEALGALLQPGALKTSGSPPAEGRGRVAAGLAAARPPAQGVAGEFRLPGGRPFRLRGLPLIVASGWLADVIAQAGGEASGATGEPPQPSRGPGLAAVLGGLGLPSSFASVYSAGVRHGQILLAIRASGEQERAAVGLLRQHRAASLAGLPD